MTTALPLPAEEIDQLRGLSSPPNVDVVIIRRIDVYAEQPDLLPLRPLQQPKFETHIDGS